MKLQKRMRICGKAHQYILAGVLLLLSVPACMTGCKKSGTEVSVDRLGNYAYTLKVLDGLFYEWKGELYLVSGTEVHYGTNSRVFAYNVTRDEIAFCTELEECSSMTAFCDAGDFVCFGTIGSSSAVYSYDKTAHTMKRCADIPVRGIYSLAWNGENVVFAGTKDPAALYACDLQSGSSEMVCSGFTEERFVRSLSYLDGFCYLGIGTKADLVAVEVSTGNWKSVLPEQYRNETWIYAQCSYDGKIAMVVSPSRAILEYDASNGAIRELEFPYLFSNDEFLASSPEALSDAQAATNLLGDLLVLRDGAPTGTVSPLGFSLSYWDAYSQEILGLTSSGVFRRLTPDGKVLFQKSFVDVLEKSWILPTDFLAYSDVLYVPERHFLCGRVGETPKAFLAVDEPQASTVTEKGIYTANYTECRV